MTPAFYILALFTIVSAFCAMALPGLVHCALCLALAFLGVAGLFLQLNSGFVAFAQVLVYVGAVAILIVFAILLTRNAENREPRTSTNWLLGLLLTGIVGALLVNAVFSTSVAVSGKPASAPSVKEIGQALMTSHLVPLELIGLLLTVALLGAVVLALPEPEKKGQGGAV